MEQHRHRIIIINTMEKVQVHHRLQQEMQETTMIIIIPHICNIFSLLLAFCRFFSSSPYSFLYLHLLHTLHSVLFFSILCDTVKKIIIIKTNNFPNESEDFHWSPIGRPDVRISCSVLSGVHLSLSWCMNITHLHLNHNVACRLVRHSFFFVSTYGDELWRVSIKTKQNLAWTCDISL